MKDNVLKVLADSSGEDVLFLSLTMQNLAREQIVALSTYSAHTKGVLNEGWGEAYRKSATDTQRFSLKISKLSVNLKLSEEERGRTMLKDEKEVNFLEWLLEELEDNIKDFKIVVLVKTSGLNHLVDVIDSDRHIRVICSNNQHGALIHPTIDGKPVDTATYDVMNRATS